MSSGVKCFFSLLENRLAKQAHGFLSKRFFFPLSIFGLH